MIQATVTQASPFRVRVDGAASDSPATLLGGEAPLNGRVYVIATSPALLVTAIAGSYASAAALTAETARATAAEAALAAGDVKRFTALYGTGAATVLTVPHGLATEAVDISVYGPTSGYEVLTVTVDTINQATVTFDVAPPPNSVRVVVLA